jgi:hypothetical protein
MWDQRKKISLSSQNGSELDSNSFLIPNQQFFQQFPTFEDLEDFYKKKYTKDSTFTSDVGKKHFLDVLQNKGQITEAIEDIFKFF